MVLPHDCGVGDDFVTGGFILKLMDNVAGICAVRHCRTNVVTASLDSIDFIKGIKNGEVRTNKKNEQKNKQKKNKKPN